MDSKKIANNILEFMFDPTVFPVKNRLYFRPEEILKNESFDAAKADALKAYGSQRKNSDFYPSKNRQQTQREASIMDRKTLIASMDVLSQQFDESDPIGKDLKTMAYAVSKMSDEELVARTVEAKKKMEMIKCPTCGGKVMAQTGYCLHCKKKIKDMKKTATEVSSDFWSKEASDAVKKALLSDVCGMDEPEEKKEPEEEVPAPAPEEKEEAPAPKKEKAPPPPAPKEEEEVEAGKMCKEEASTKDAAKKCKEEEASKEKDAGKKPEELDEEKDAGKKPDPKELEEKDATKKEDAKKKVDTEILSYEGIELGEAVAGLVSADEVGELTADEKSKLDSLFQ